MEKLLEEKLNQLIAHSGENKYIFNSENDALKWSANIQELEAGYKLTYPEQMNNLMWRVIAGKKAALMEMS